MLILARKQISITIFASIGQKFPDTAIFQQWNVTLTRAPSSIKAVAVIQLPQYPVVEWVYPVQGKCNSPFNRISHKYNSKNSHWNNFYTKWNYLLTLESGYHLQNFKLKCSQLNIQLYQVDNIPVFVVLGRVADLEAMNRLVVETFCNRAPSNQIFQMKSVLCHLVQHQGPTF